MRRSSYQWGELAAAGLLLGAGIFVVAEAWRYPLGSAARMGPGYFPVILGVILTANALLLLLAEFVRRKPGEVAIRFRPIVALCSAVALFALTVPRFGLAPAVFLAVFVSSLADSRFRIGSSLLLSAAMAVLSSLIFVVGLGLQMPVVSL